MVGRHVAGCQVQLSSLAALSVDHTDCADHLCNEACTLYVKLVQNLERYGRTDVLSSVQQQAVHGPTPSCPSQQCCVTGHNHIRICQQAVTILTAVTARAPAAPFAFCAELGILCCKRLPEAGMCEQSCQSLRRVDLIPMATCPSLLQKLPPRHRHRSLPPRSLRPSRHHPTDQRNIGLSLTI